MKGLRDSSSQGICPESYLEFSRKFILISLCKVSINNEIKMNIKDMENNCHIYFPNTQPTINICNTNHVPSSLEVAPSSTIRFIDADNQEKPLSYFCSIGWLLDRQIKIESLWFSNLNKTEYQHRLKAIIVGSH